MLAACSRDAMSARRKHVALVEKRGGGGGKACPGVAARGSAGPPEKDTGHDKDQAPPHPGDEGSLRRWEELLRSVDVTGGRWRPDVVGGGIAGG